jgi:hypothetical protein
MTLFQIYSHSIFDNLWGNFQVTLNIWTNIWSYFLASFGFVKNFWRFETFIAVGTSYIKSCISSISQLFTCVLFHNWAADLQVFIIIFFQMLLALLKLFRISSKALCNKTDFNTFNVLKKSLNWWQKLLWNIPVYIQL